MPKSPPSFRLDASVNVASASVGSGDQARPTARERGYTTRWDKARKAFLAKHPFCTHCQQHGKLTPSTVVDHIVPHRGDKKLFWARTNWQALCETCHNRKTRRGE